MEKWVHFPRTQTREIVASFRVDALSLAPYNTNRRADQLMALASFHCQLGIIVTYHGSNENCHGPSVWIDNVSFWLCQVHHDSCRSIILTRCPSRIFETRKKNGSMREKDAGVEEKLGSARNLMKSCQMALATLVPPESIDAAGSLFLPYPSELWLGRGDTVRKCQIFSLTFVLIASRYHDGDHCSEKIVGFHSLFFHSHGFPPTSSFGNCEAFSNHLLQMRFKQQLCRSSSCKLQK